ncbi:uncharacterized protein BX664DRAFT_369235 [Halteromyces radiatus]|uniref:uncharacterized protein n=1 Tax=Halteromyces radiatus TaxID=101107 RepID=UPI00221F501C|nr:uncharacterized protein BX664DRAFT_369235 [Halteromyces radiatus]KAI8078811.1 hypothetical protein BX664DRAFT_369235 [Halteromyces radiatus]
MHLSKIFLLSFLFTALFYECLCVEAVNEDKCLADIGDSFVKRIAKCKDEHCVKTVYGFFILGAWFRCKKNDIYELCYQRPNNGLRCVAGKSNVLFFGLRKCESYPGHAFWLYLGKTRGREEKDSQGSHHDTARLNLLLYLSEMESTDI